MPLTQVELVSTNDEVEVRWIDHNPNTHLPLRVGRGVSLLESGRFWRINRIFTTLSRVEDLPTKHRLGTIVELN